MSDIQKVVEWHEFHQFITFRLTPRTPDKIFRDGKFSKIVAKADSLERKYMNEEALVRWNNIDKSGSGRVPERVQDFFAGLQRAERRLFNEEITPFVPGSGSGGGRKDLSSFLFATAKIRGVLGSDKDDKNLHQYLDLVGGYCDYDYAAYSEAFKMLLEAFNSSLT
jgi:hypothetical protein